MSFGTFFLTDIHAQGKEKIAPTTHESIREIILQIQVRNSDGALVSYTEPSIFYLRNIFMIHDYLDSKSDDRKSVVTIDGKKYEQIEWKFQSVVQDSYDQQSGYQLGYQGYGILNARLNGAISNAGDTVSVYWKITRQM
jgi:hypothetical protein